MNKKDIINIGMGDLSDGCPENGMGELGAEAPEQAATEDSENMISLKHPIKIAGEEVNHLEFDFDALTAKDLHQASKYLKNLGIPVSVPALDYEYQLVLFARAVKIKMRDVELADLMRLSATDAAKATGMARDFLLDKDPGLKDLGSEE